MSMVGGAAHPEELLSGYALDALGDEERAEVEEHLATSAACRAELATYHETLAQLTGLVEEGPPPALWARIAADLPPQVEPLPTAPTTAPVLDLDRGRARPGRWRPALAGLAAAAAVVVAVGVTGVVASRDSSERTDLAAQAEAALADPAARVLTLTDPDGAAAARVVVAPEEGSFVILDGLGELAGGDVYQLWSLEGEAPVSLGVLGDGRARVVAVPIPAGTDALAISAEGPGGSNSPTLPPVGAV